jgi:hypothetical protein
LQASDASEPVFPVFIPITGANPNATSLSSDTVIELHEIPAPGVQGIAQMVSLHFAPDVVPGLQTLGI